MTFAGGSWRFEYSVSDAMLDEGIDLVVQYHFERRRKLFGLLGSTTGPQRESES